MLGVVGQQSCVRFHEALLSHVNTLTASSRVLFPRTRAEKGHVMKPLTTVRPQSSLYWMLETPESHAGDGTREAWPKEWGDWKTTERIQNLFTKTQNFSKESQKSTAVVLCTVEVHNNSTGYQKPIASNSHNRPMSRLFYDGYHLFQIADFNANVSIKVWRKCYLYFFKRRKDRCSGFNQQRSH